jgi:transcriptional regulator with XRE-family HTH domain
VVGIGKEVRKVIQNARQQSGLTQIDMAQRLGVTQATYSRIEKGKTSVNEETLERIGKILDVRKEELVIEDKSPEQQATMREQASVLNPRDIPAMLRDLKELLNDGIITQEEFQDKKKELLARL